MNKKQQLIEDLSNLVSQMERVANQMIKFKGEIKEHGKELLGASNIAWEWVEGIRKEK